MKTATILVKDRASLTMKLNKRWLIGFLLVVVVAVGVYAFQQIRQGAANTTTGAAANSALATDSTVTIQPASTVLQEVSAAGNIELVSRHYVALTVDGMVERIDVKAGDVVEKGAPLLALNTIELERALRRAELNVDAKSSQLAQLTTEADPSEIAVAAAELAEARENLANVQSGPSAEELAAAQASAASAWARYNELLAGPTESELVQLSADLKKKEVALAEAQSAYNKIAWRNDVGVTAESAQLQQASIDYEAALAAYTQATAPAATSDLQSALASAQDAQEKLNVLRQSATAAEVGSAEAKVVEAEAKLATLQNGPTDADLQETRIALEQALVDLEEAHANLAAAQVAAPVAGTVLSIEAEVGERIGRGNVTATLADTTQLELTINVAEVDIRQVAAGQEATIILDALPGERFDGVVTYIAPASDSSSGLVNYPVTIRLVDDNLAGVRPGMTAVATLTDTNMATAESWLVPADAIQQEGDQTTVLVVRGDTTVPVRVTTSALRGEWTVVHAPELRAGDQVIGSVSSYIDQTEGGFPGGGGGSGPFRRQP